MNDLPTLIFPMAFYVFYICLGFVGVFLIRVKGIKSKTFSGKYFKNYSNKSSVPEHFLVLERHVDNQFQAPMLFLITCVVVIALNRSSFFITSLAWGFVISRLVHSCIHLGYNNIVHRALAYGFGLLMILLIWTTLLLV